jgi:hypothetical protein
MRPERSNSSSSHLPSLDGLRAISIALVLIGHLDGTHKIGRLPGIHVFGDLAHFGVIVFFVISGFLITSLLIREYEHTGRVSLKLFYLRRALRIFPAAFAYIGVISLLSALGAIVVTRSNLLFAATYLVNYLVHPAWYIGHLWRIPVSWSRVSRSGVAMVSPRGVLRNADVSHGRRQFGGRVSAGSKPKAPRKSILVSHFIPATMVAVNAGRNPRDQSIYEPHRLFCCGHRIDQCSSGSFDSSLCLLLARQAGSPAELEAGSLHRSAQLLFVFVATTVPKQGFQRLACGIPPELDVCILGRGRVLSFPGEAVDAAAKSTAHAVGW